MTNIAITGALGRMGTLVIQEMARSPDMRIVAGLDAVGAGRMLSGGIAVRDASELKAALQESRPDVLIDFTIAAAAVENVCTAADMGVNLVVGTTGFSADQHAKMRAAIEGRVAALEGPSSDGVTPVRTFGRILAWGSVRSDGSGVHLSGSNLSMTHAAFTKDYSFAFDVQPSGGAYAVVTMPAMYTGLPGATWKSQSGFNVKCQSTMSNDCEFEAVVIGN